MAFPDLTKVLRALDWAWNTAFHGLPGQASAEELARRVMTPGHSLDQQLDKLVRSHTRLAATAGFCTNLGGVSLLPASLPANLAGSLFVQLRMVQAMAIVCGHDPGDLRVRAVCGLCLCGSKAAEVGARCGARLGATLAESLSAGMATETLARINRLVGLRLLARLGESGALQTSRLLPLLGGVAGALGDAALTRAVGRAAILAFAPASATSGKTAHTARAAQGFPGNRQDGS